MSYNSNRQITKNTQAVFTDGHKIISLIMRAHLHTYPTGFYYSNSVWERDHTKVKRIIMSQLRLRIWSGLAGVHVCCIEVSTKSVPTLQPSLAIWWHYQMYQKQCMTE